MNIEIRNYRHGDYSTIIDLWKAAGLPYKPYGRDSRESIEKEMGRACGNFLFAINSGKAIGLVLATFDGRKGWINRLSVLPQYRNKGVAWQLVVAAEQWFEQNGIHIYACLIEDYNNTSFEVFKKMGYIPFEGIHYLTKRKFPEI